MSEYSALAPFYDELMRENDYAKWADFFELLFSLHDTKVKSILDMACGTGELSYIMAERGYDLTGCDISPDMLSVAENKRRLSKNPMFINQDIRKLDLCGTVDAVLCSLDAVNYLKPAELGRVFRRVNTFLEPNGVFIFDINTRAKFERIDGQCFIAEGESVFCAWQADFHAKNETAVFTMDIFSKKSRLWKRRREEHTEYCHNPFVVEEELKKAGFSLIEKYAELQAVPPSQNEERLFFLVKK